MVIAGLDIASKTGLAVIDGEKITTATWKAPRAKDQVFEDAHGSINPVHSGQIGRAFEDYLRSFIIEHRVQYVAIEAPLRSNAQKTVTMVDMDAGFAGQAIRKEVKNITSMATIYRLYGLSFIACSVCARFNIQPVLVNQSAWRKSFLASGSTKNAKDAAVEQCRRLRIEISSVDAAEAVGIAWWLRSYLNPAKFARANDLFNLPKTNDLTLSGQG